MNLSKSSVTATWSAEKVLQTNKLIRNTYILLSATLLFSAAMAGLAMVMNAPYLGVWLTLGGYFGLLYAVHKCQNSTWGIFWVFALTGFMGFTLGPILNAYISVFSNGVQLVMMALGGTGVIFLGLSGYALTTRKNFSFMGGFLMVGILTAFVAGLVAYFFDLPTLSLAVSAAFILLSSGIILYQTSEMVHGGETNYILATLTLYVSLYNLFTSLLHLLGEFAGED